MPLKEGSKSKRIMSGEEELMDSAPKRIKEINFREPDANAPEWFRNFVVDNNTYFKHILDSNNFLSDLVEGSCATIKTHSDEVKHLQQKVDVLEIENTSLKHELATLKEKFMTMDIDTRKSNLIFTGIPEERGEKTQDCVRKVSDSLSRIPNLNCSDLKIRACYRIGRFKRGYVRPILLSAHWCLNQKENILKNRKHMSAGIYVSEDFPEEINSRRKQLMPVWKAAKKLDAYAENCKLINDKLVVNGITYTAGPKNNLHTLPADINLQSLCEKQSDDALIYFGQNHPFSNFNGSVMKIDGQQYSCGEQFIQATKASLFNDDNTQARILQASTPQEMKRLGDQIKDFDRKTWEDKAYDCAIKLVQNKFSQHPLLLSMLKATGSRVIGEATKDQMWGIGLSLSDPSAPLPNTWTGKNIMGKALMCFRDS